MTPIMAGLTSTEREAAKVHSPRIQKLGCLPKTLHDHRAQPEWIIRSDSCQDLSRAGAEQ